MPDNLQPFDDATVHFDDSPRMLAPTWHTLAVVLVLVVAAYVRHGRNSGDMGADHINLYLGSIGNGWLLLGASVAGLYYRRRFFYDTLERGAKSWGKELLRAVGVFATYFVLSFAITFTIRHTQLLHSVNQEAVAALAPHSLRELALWLLVAITAGFCEEHVFRGYFLPQCIAWLRSQNVSPRVATVFGVLISSMLFGGLHLYEGVGGAVLVTGLGVIFCCYALRFRNLRAVILAHALQDFFVGLVLLLRHGHGV